MKKTLRLLALLMLVVTMCFAVVSCGGDNNQPETPHEHSYVNGKCECGESDPNYQPPHEHSYVNGKCECGETDPNYQPPHEHVFGDNGMCECGEIDPNFQGGIGDGGDEESGYTVIISAEAADLASFLGYVHMYMDDSISSGYDHTVTYQLEEGTKVQLYADAISGYVFAGWYTEAANGGLGELVSLEKGYTFTVSGNVKYIAHFVNANEKYTINITAGGLGKVSVNGSEPKETISYVASPMEELTITVTPDEYYTLDGWYVDDEIFSYDKTLTIKAKDHIDIEARIIGKDVEFNFKIMGLGKDVNKYGLDMGHDSWYFNIDGSYNTGTAFSRYGETVRIMARPAEGYSFVGFAIKHRGETTYVYDGYVEIPVTDIDSYSISVTFDEKVVPYGEKPIDINITQFDSGYDRDPRPGYYGCEDCCVYVNGHKFTGEGKITVNPGTIVTLVAFPCEECEHFIYYKHADSELEGYSGARIYSFTATTAKANKDGYYNNYFNFYNETKKWQR